MAEKKSILEEALLDITNIQNALNANTKEILRSVAKEEIDSVVKESLEEKAYVEEEVETLEEASKHESDETEKEEETEHEKDEEPKEKGEMKEGMYEEEGLKMEDEMGMGDMSPEEIDMTGASDDDVIAIYKKLSGDDEIEIVGDELHLNITEPGEYVVKLNSLDDIENVEDSDDLKSDMDDMDANVSVDSDEEDFNDDDEEENEDENEVEYDIEMGDEDEDESNEDEDESNEDESNEDEEENEDANEELEESMPFAHAQGTQKHGGHHKPESAKRQSLEEVQKAKQIVSETAKKYNSLLTEAKKLKAENDEFRTALKEFRTKLVETVVFNSNLTYVTKLFMEHSTTKAEKQTIIKRFDEEVSNLKESKKLYKTIANELETRKPIAESVESKIIKEATTSTSKQLNESTAYVDPSTKRIMDLIKRVEKR